MENANFEFDYYRNGGIEITKYNGNAEVVKIPARINGLPVTKIGHRAFEYCNSLTKVIIPDTVKIIGEMAFNRCPNLREVVWPKNLRGILMYAFDHCVQLRSAILPGKTLFIEESAFRSCTALSEVYIPNSVIDIEEYAFANCTGLKKFSMPKQLSKNISRKTKINIFRRYASPFVNANPDCVCEKR